MPRVVATHPVGNMDTWLAGGEERAKLFKQFSGAYRIYRHQSASKVAIVWENADLQKFQTTMQDPETERAKTRHTVLEPVEIYIEVEGGR
jgi:hypothetical protein